MTLHPCTIGIDVSKAHLDRFDTQSRQSSRIPNTAQALAEPLAAWRRSHAFVVFEATGTYDEVLRRALHAAGMPHARVDPAKARAFARYAGVLAKTDKLDARMLARMAEAGELRPQPPLDEAREALRQLHRRRDQLVAMRQMERTRLKEARHADEAESLERHIAFLSGEIADLEARTAALIKATPAFQLRQASLRQVPGIGPVAAATLLALMPELGQISNKAAAALAGLAPFNRDSGRWRGERHIAGGRRRVREALYMAAVAASRSNTRLAAFYKSLRAAGKPPKLAFIALARKILVTLNAIIRDGSIYVR